MEHRNGVSLFLQSTTFRFEPGLSSIGIIVIFFFDLFVCAALFEGAQVATMLF